jgi:hypothetical protein
MGKKREILYTRSQHGMKVTVENCRPPKSRVFRRCLQIFSIISIFWVTFFGYKSYIDRSGFLLAVIGKILLNLLSLTIGVLKDLATSVANNW